MNTDLPELLHRSRRDFIVRVGASVLGLTVAARPAKAALVSTDIDKLTPYGNGTLPSGIRSRRISDVNGLTIHFLESGFEAPDRPVVLLLHGFPELAYSWRKVMLPLAAAGYHVIAPDRRGYGRTTGWDDAYDVDLDSFSILNMVRDSLALVSALGHRSVAAVIGHDFGSPVAAWCALIRPDVFRSAVMMSAPFPGPPLMPFDTVARRPANTAAPDIDAELATLARPRKYYMRYFTSREAAQDLQSAPQGLHDFLRAYFHYKSADWKENKPFPLKARTAQELAKLPTYYVMDLEKGMAETVAQQMPSAAQVTACKWLTEPELAVYVSEYARTGFQGGLQAYRCVYNSKQIAEQRLFSGRTLDVPTIFIGGKSDWGVYQTPGALDVMKNKVCTQMRSVELIDGAGHWVQQEQPDKVNDVLLRFLRDQTQKG